MGRRVFTRGFQVGGPAYPERGVSVAQAARDLEIHEDMLRRRAKELRMASSRLARSVALRGAERFPVGLSRLAAARFQRPRGDG
jgi:hypothetical protein